MEACSQLAPLCALTLGCCHTNARSSSSPYVFIYHKRGLPQCSRGLHVPHTVFPCWCQALGGRCSVTRQRGHHPAQPPTHPPTHPALTLPHHPEPRLRLTPNMSAGISQVCPLIWKPLHSYFSVPAAGGLWVTESSEAVGEDGSAECWS